MTFKRPDKRKNEDLRLMKAEVSIIPRADGSALFQIGKTIAYAAVYGPRALHPTYLRDPEKGILRCNYNMMSFSGAGDRVKPGPSRRSKEISLVTEKALLPVLDLSEFPNTVIDVFIELIQTDAGTRCAGIIAASMALADAGLKMKDLVSAVSVGIIENQIIADLSKEEEDYEKGATDMPVAMTGRKSEITLLQMDGLIEQKQLQQALELAKKSNQRIYELQIKALKEKYQNG